MAVAGASPLGASHRAGGSGAAAEKSEVAAVATAAGNGWEVAKMPSLVEKKIAALTRNAEERKLAESTVEMKSGQFEQKQEIQECDLAKDDGWDIEDMYEQMEKFNPDGDDDDDNETIELIRELREYIENLRTWTRMRSMSSAMTRPWSFSGSSTFWRMET